MIELTKQRFNEVKVQLVEWSSKEKFTKWNKQNVPKTKLTIAKLEQIIYREEKYDSSYKRIDDW